MKKCPYCGEKIRNDAVICRFCNRDLPSADISQKLKGSGTNNPLKNNRGCVIASSSIIMVFGLLCAAFLVFFNSNLKSIVRGFLPTPTAHISAELYGKGKIAFVSDRSGSPEIYVMNADGTNPVRLTTRGGSHPDWSPDGSRIAFATEMDGNSEIYIMNRDGSNPVRITNDISVDRSPSWSPDGTKIAFVSYRASDHGDVYVMDSNGTNLTEPYVSMDQDGGYCGHIGSLGWSPDGTSIVVWYLCVGGGSPPYIKAVNSDGTNLRTILSASDLDLPDPSNISLSDPAWSPDGNRLAYSTGHHCEGFKDDWNESINLYTPNNATSVSLTDSFCGDMAYDPFWSPDGDMIVYVEGEDNDAEIGVMYADGSYIDTLTNNDVADYSPVWTK